MDLCTPFKTPKVKQLRETFKRPGRTIILDCEQSLFSSRIAGKNASRARERPHYSRLYRSRAQLALETRAILDFRALPFRA